MRMTTAMTPILAGLLLLGAGGGATAAGQDSAARVPTGAPGRADPREPIVEQQLRSARERMATIGYAPYHSPAYDLLAADSLDTALAELPAGAYRAVAVCDGDCADLDLMVTDEAGNVLGMDVLRDDVPVVDFQTAGGQIGLTVKMIVCTTERCAYGLQLFRADA